MSLVLRDVSCSFGGLKAIASVSMEIRPGLVTGLIGPNGAGKSTLINALSGFVHPSSGKVVLDVDNGERDVTRLGPEARVRLGISRTFQRPRIDPSSTVRDVLHVASYSTTKTRLLGSVFGGPRAIRERRRVAERAEELIEQFGLREVADSSTRDLPGWQARLLEVARVSAVSPRYVLLDEPAAGLDSREQERLRQHICRLAEGGSGVLLVEHNFGFVASVSNHVSVLDRGQAIASGTADEVRSNPHVIEAYLGASDDHS